MPKIKDMARIAEKWTKVTPQRQEEYVNGIDNPRTDWQQATTAAIPRYNSGIQASIANKSFDKGVAKAGTAKWQKNAREKGPNRWAQGVTLGKDNYATGFAPYARVIETTTLPARGPKGDPANINRVAVMAKALNDAKKAQTK
jgi:hypothetical protein